ncbi:MAG TPA: FHA domain-containing protein [Gemmataceae bacterium]|jgi:hypothetical protein|nr:FHA domain-containing protein [Gemmataceae bacterium]
MICPSCGAANEDGVLFCEKCKADLETPAAEEPIALEPIALEPVMDTPTPAVLEPIHLEPVAQESTIEPVAGDETVEQPRKPKTATPPPLPATPTTPIPINPKLIVVRGQRMDVTYPLYAGKNYLGRTDDKPVDIDLEDQEAADRIWTSRQHAVISLEDGKLLIEDLNSLNGTFVNRTRVHPGQVRELVENDVVQVGTVHMKVVLN